MNRYLWALLSLFLFAPLVVAKPVADVGKSPHGDVAIAVSLSVPECRMSGADLPVDRPPVGYERVRTDRVDWNGDGWCDLAYFFAPKDLSARQHLGGFAVDFFTFTPPAAWQRVTRMINASGSVENYDPHTPFPTPDSLFSRAGGVPWSHFLIGSVEWVDNPRHGLLMVADDNIYQWQKRQNATEGAAFSELADASADVMRLNLVAAHQLRTLDELLQTPDYRTLNQLDFSGFADSPDLRIIRVARVLCLMRGDLACLSEAVKSAALHPGVQWLDIGALQQAMILQADFHGVVGQDLALAALNKYESHWSDSTASWRNWYEQGRHHALDAPLPQTALDSIRNLLALPVLWPKADKSLFQALNDYFVLQHFLPWKHGRLADGRDWQIGFADGALMMQLDGHWRRLTELPWVGYQMPMPEPGGQDDCMRAFCGPNSPYPARLLPSDALKVKGTGESRDFTASTPWTGYGGSDIEGECHLVEHPAYFQMDCGIGYDGGAHPDEWYGSYFFSKNPAIFGLAVPDSRDTCMGAKYDEAAFDHAWNDLLASCAYEMDTEKEGMPDKAHYAHWLKAGQEIVGEGLPSCAQVEMDSSTNKLSVFANTGMIGREARSTACDQASVGVPLENPEQYIHLHLTSPLVVSLLTRPEDTAAHWPLGNTHAERMLLDRDYVQLDRQLNRQYQALLKATPPEKRPTLIEAERAWLRQRDRLLAGKSIQIKDTCAMDGCSGTVQRAIPVHAFLDERIDQLKRQRERVKKQKELAQINFYGRFPKCVTPLAENQCDVPILVTWCWDTEGKLAQWQDTEMVCARVGRVTSMIEPGQVLYAPMPHSNDPLSAQIKVFHSCVADDRTRSCVKN